MKAAPPQDFARTSASSYHIARRLLLLPRLRTATELLHAEEFRYVQLSSFSVLVVLGRFRTVLYVEYLITCGGQRALHVSHITQMTYFFVLLTVVAETFITLVIVAGHDPPHVTQHHFRSHTDVPFVVHCFRMAKHVWLLKCLLPSVQG